MYRLIYILLLLPIITFSQKSTVNTHYVLENPHPLDLRKSKVSFQRIHLGASRVEDVEKYLKYNIDNLKSLPNTSFKLIHNIESPAGLHLTFVQLCRSIPIYRSQVKVNLDKKGNIRSIFDNSFIITDNPLTLFSGEISVDFPDESIVSTYLNNIRDLLSSNIENVYFMHFSNEERGKDLSHLISAAKIEVSKTDDSNYEVIINNKGEVLYKKDLNRYQYPFSLPATKLIQTMLQDSLISANVFLPDPLTTAGVTYGSPYIDDNNHDVSELDAELAKVNIVVDLTNDTFRLSGPYAKIDEFSSPAVFPAYSATPFFHYTRTQQGFEDVNAYYHINVFQQYIQSLGFTNLVNYPVRIDAHALNGSDQSMYYSGKIYFGEGGVDDAEDADVIIHEYSHAIMESASPGTSSGFERQSLEEGFGDYLAVSYSRYINPYNWQNIFSWDGHNEFWGGRNAASTKHYPEDLSGDIHFAGEIWSSALMQVWEDIGRETTDQILLQSLYSYAAGMTMTDAAYLFLQTDSMLNGGVNYFMIYKRFQDRGFLPSLPFLAAYISSYTNDNCNGDCVGLATINTLGGTAPYSYLWDPQAGGQTTYTATGLCSGSYNVTVTDSAGDTACATIVISEAIVNSGFTSTVFASGYVNFNNTSTGATDWYWWFGDGATSASANPKHKYDSTGSYNVRLVASIGGNCTDTSWSTVVIDNIAGIHDLSNPGTLLIYPNPTTGIINIKFDPLTTGEEITSIRVYNTTGQIVNEICDKSRLKTDNYVLDLSGQLNGVYFLIITSPIEIIPFKLIKF
ncbi:MAG: T9SS type A sorting domain-containing protein [Bacteroidota bacterium]